MKGVVTAMKRRGVGEPDLLAAFCEYLRVERGLARLSIESYAGDLKKWMAFLAERKRGSLAVGTSLRAQPAQTASSSEMGDKQEGEPHCYSLERPRRRVSGNLLAPQPAQPQRASGNLLVQARREDVRAFLERLFAEGPRGGRWRASFRRCGSATGFCCWTGTSSMIRRSTSIRPGSGRCCRSRWASAEVEQSAGGHRHYGAEGEVRARAEAAQPRNAGGALRGRAARRRRWWACAWRT